MQNCAHHNTQGGYLKKTFQGNLINFCVET
jgi:hypothetical protein